MIIRVEKKKLVDAIERLLDYRPLDIWFSTHGFDLEFVGADIKGIHHRVKVYDAFKEWQPLRSKPITSVLIRIKDDEDEAEIEFDD